MKILGIVGLVLLFCAFMFAFSLLGGLIWWLILHGLIGLSLTYWQCVGISFGVGLITSGLRQSTTS